ncbi:MAG: hypothetical protein ACE5PT_06445 [Gemmatimonadales bacterium]
MTGRGTGFSFPYGTSVVVYGLLLVGIASARGALWGNLLHLTYLALVGLFGWMALSGRQYRQAHAKDPTLTRLTWMLNWGLFFAVIPLVAWAVLGAPALLGR